MADKNVLFEVLCEQLLPARQRLHQSQIKNGLIRTLNRLMWIIPVLSLAVFVFAWSIGSGQNTKEVLFVILIAGLLWTGVVCLWAWFHRPDWFAVACHIDQATNGHNLIAIAYEHSCLESASLFARVAIWRGLDLLNSSGMDRFKPAIIPVQKWRVACGGMVLVLLWGLLLWIPARTDILGGSQKNRIVSADDIADSTLQNQSQQMQPASQPPAGQPRVLSQQASNKSVLDEAMQNITKLAGLSNKSLSSPEQAGAQPSQATPTQSGGGVSARSEESSKKENIAVRPPSKSDKAGKMSEQTMQQENISNAPQKGVAGKSPDAESDIKALMAAGGIEELSEQDDAYWDRQQQQQNAPSGIGQKPELSDRQSAPNRELGLSGKPGDKAGDGRGGPGMIKKSRATASALSATTIPVQVKGQTQPGKSKSYTQSLPLSATESAAATYDEAYSAASEGDISVYIPDSQWNSTIENYFLNLRKANF